MVSQNRNKPYDEFEAKVKELITLIDEPITLIDYKVKEFEEKRINERKEEILLAYEEIVPGELQDYIPLERIYGKKWTNAGTKMKDIREELTSRVATTNADINAIKAMRSEKEETALNFYMENNNLASAIKYLSDYEIQKAEILKRKEAEEAARRERELEAERERIRLEERRRILEEEEIKRKAEKETVEKLKEVDEEQARLGNCTELVERGSFITSELKLMERWGWGRKKVKLFLNFLESQKMIERNANNKRTAITIVNYGFYQDCDLPKEQQKDSKRTAKEQRRDSTGTAKEHKQERKNERMKEYIDTNVSIKQHSIQSIIDAWNQLEPYGIKMIYRINPGSKRCTSLIALLEQFGEEKVIQAVDKVKQSDFLQGKTDARFSLNFDWFIKAAWYELRRICCEKRKEKRWGKRLMQKSFFHG